MDLQGSGTIFDIFKILFISIFLHIIQIINSLNIKDCYYYIDLYL